MITKKQLEEFANHLLEKEMMIAQEMAITEDPFYRGAFTWINAIRHEFKERFLDD